MERCRKGWRMSGTSVCTRNGPDKALVVQSTPVVAKKAGVTKFECYSSINGEAFYAALGFERLEVIKVKMINDIDFPSVRMLATI